MQNQLKMYKIVQKLELKEIPLSNITNDCIIGIEWSSNNKCKVITIDSNTYASITLKDTDLRAKWTASSVESYVKSSLEQGNHVNAYKFDSEEELLEWLLK
jgi:tRNA A37 threonylcarbamoyladenosine biosynthesis protein TsaE